MLPGWLQSIIKYFSSSIGKKIIIPYAVLTLVLAAVGIFVITQLVADSFEARLQGQLLEAGRVVSDEIVNRERVRLEVERLVANTRNVAMAVVDRDTDTLDERISPIIANTEIIDSIIIVDTQGKEVMRFQRDPSAAGLVKTVANSGVDLSGWSSVKQVLANPDGNKETDLVREEDTNELVVFTVGPIRTTEDGLVGVALVGTFLSNEVAVLRSLALAQLTLFNESAQVMATTFSIEKENYAEAFEVFTPERYQEVIETKDETLLDQIELPVSEAKFPSGLRPFYSTRSSLWGLCSWIRN